MGSVRHLPSLRRAGARPLRSSQAGSAVACGARVLHGVAPVHHLFRERHVVDKVFAGGVGLKDQIAALAVDLDGETVRHGLAGGVDHEHVLLLRREVAAPPRDVSPDGVRLLRRLDAHAIISQSRRPARLGHAVVHVLRLQARADGENDAEQQPRPRFSHANSPVICSIPCCAEVGLASFAVVPQYPSEGDSPIFVRRELERSPVILPSPL